MIGIVLMLEVVLTGPDHHEARQEEIDQRNQEGDGPDLYFTCGHHDN